MSYCYSHLLLFQRTRNPFLNGAQVVKGVDFIFADFLRDCWFIFAPNRSFSNERRYPSHKHTTLAQEGGYYKRSSGTPSLCSPEPPGLTTTFSNLCVLWSMSPHSTAEASCASLVLWSSYPWCNFSMYFYVFPYFSLVQACLCQCFSPFFSTLKYRHTTWFCLLLRKQPSWTAAQLSQSWPEGFRDRPANRLSKACAKIALTEGHSATQCTAQIFALISVLVCICLCMGI